MQNKSEQSTLRVMVNSFVVIPLLVAVSFAFVFSLIQILIEDERSALDYLNDIKVGGATKRWQSAFELSKILNNSDSIPIDDLFIHEMVSAFEQSNHDDDRVKQYLALAMGKTGNKQFIDPLLDQLQNENSDNIPFLIRALGELKAKNSAEYLVEYLHDENEVIRLQTVIALGHIGDLTSIDLLKKMLYDEQPNIQWETAVSLAKMGDSSGKKQLLNLLDEDYYAEFPEVDILEKHHARIIAIKVAIHLNDSDLNQKISQIANEEKNIEIRKAAMQVMNKMESTLNHLRGNTLPLTEDINIAYG